MDPARSSPFFRKRALYFLLVPLPLLAVCQHFGQGLLGLVLMALAFWPLPFRCRVDANGIRISWLIASECWAWDELASAQLEADTRSGVIGRRGQVLTIARRNASRMILRGKAEVLAELASLITARIQQGES